MAKLTYRDSSNNQIAAYHFEYDSLGRLIRSTEYGANNTTVVQRTEHLYDTYNRLSAQSWVIQGDSFSESYTYNDPPVGADDSVRPQDGSLKQMTTATGATIDYTYNDLKQLHKTTVKSGETTLYTSAYAYRNLTTTQTTAQIEYHNVRDAGNNVITGAKYVYDDVGNIIGIYESQQVDENTPRRPLALYEYDVQNQLTSEIIYTYDSDNLTTTPDSTTTYAYTYDTAGNILAESKNGTVTKTYTYGNGNWRDLLTKYNGTTITYDAIGNPIIYENDASSYHFTWVNGRRLSQATVDGSESYYIGYDYDLDGIRTKKTATVDSTGVTTTHNYITQNGKVVRETIKYGTTTREFDFIYDESGKPFAVKYTINGTTSAMFYYVLNLQGDVVKIIAENGTVMANYSYNAWGEVLSVTNASGNAITAPGHLANLNPIRYRGYYYDTETGFYYLQSRYYDPTMHRFINADSYTSTGQGILGYNMFAYCNNDPVVFADHNGKDLTITIATKSYTYEDAFGRYTITVAIKRVLGEEHEVKSNAQMYIYNDCPIDIDYDIWSDTAELSLTLLEYRTASISLSAEGITYSQTENLGNGYFRETSITVMPKKQNTMQTAMAYAHRNFITYEGTNRSSVQVSGKGAKILMIGLAAIFAAGAMVGSPLRTQKG